MSRAIGVVVAIFTVLIPSCCHAFASPDGRDVGIRISPANVTLVAKGTQQFMASMSGAGNTALSVNGAGNAAIQWMVAGVVGGNAHVGTISSSGLYTAPAVASNSVVTLTAVVASNSRASANAVVTVVVNPAVEEAHQQWLAGVAEAAARYGCSPDLIQQLPSETVADVVKLYVQTAHKGSCLVLSPISTAAGPAWYSFASGGTIDGVEILYLSDVNQLRIWNGVEVTSD
jgi:hypothetical protein